MTRVRGDNKKHASPSERNACDDCSRRANLEGWNLSGDEPDTGKNDQQEAHLGECDTRSMADRKHSFNGSHLELGPRPIPLGY